MQLSRALEMCREPIVKGRSHLVRLDRYALTHLLSEYDSIDKEIKQLRVFVHNAENNLKEIEQLKAEIRKLKKSELIIS
jgi:hypothetical protein